MSGTGQTRPSKVIRARSGSPSAAEIRPDLDNCSFV
jgi:hypothetical protein